MTPIINIYREDVNITNMLLIEITTKFRIFYIFYAYLVVDIHSKIYILQSQRNQQSFLRIVALFQE